MLDNNSVISFRDKLKWLTYFSPAQSQHEYGQGRYDIFKKHFPL